MQPDTVFSSGTLIDSPDGINLANTGHTIPWVAVRGQIHDWAIYAQNPHYLEAEGVWSQSRVRDMGDKVYGVENIRKLVPCSDEALKMYRK